jgi:multiple sugar transport system permease protein
MKPGRWTFGMLAPVGLFLIAIFLGPFFYMVWLSFTDLSFAAADRSGNWLGFANYLHALFADGIFIESLCRSCLFVLLCVVPQMILGIAIAEVLHSRPLAQHLLSPLFALPVLLPAVVVGLYWRILLQGEFGLASHYLSALGFAGAKGILSNPQTILVTLAAIDVWQWGPFVALVLVASRGSLPKAPLEAAWMDGASRSRAFFDVTLPALLPTIFVVSLIRAIDSFKEFDKVFILTGGGPGNASELSSIYTWRMAFKQFEFGYAAALCVLIYILIYLASQFLLARTRWRSEL